MNIEINPNKIENLAKQFNQLSLTIGDAEAHVRREMQHMLGQIRASYSSEYTVRNTVREVEDILLNLNKVATVINGKLERKSKVLDEAALRYRSEEEQNAKTIEDIYMSIPILSSMGSTSVESSLQAEVIYADDELHQDPVVAQLHDQVMNGTEEEQAEARKKLEEIFIARNTIARAQVAYETYKAFGNTAYMEGAHQEANKQREILASYGIDKKYYNAGVVVSHYYIGTNLQACSYDPSTILTKDGKQVLVIMPQDNQYLYLLGLALQGGKEGEWAKQQLSEIHEQLQEIGRAQVAWFEYHDRGMEKEKANAHRYAEQIREKLKTEYGLSSEMLDGVDYKHLWVGIGMAGKYIHNATTPVNQQSNRWFNLEGNSNIRNNKWYAHEQKLAQEAVRIEGSFEKEIQSIVKIYNNNKDIYERISKQTGVPPELIAALHYRERAGNFNVYLHNGQTLGQVTTKHPPGLYFENFEEAAVHALLSKKSWIDSLQLTYDSTDVVAMLTYAEAYNGWGYYNREKVSPYVYSGTNVYTSGKFVEVKNNQGKYVSEYRADVVDQQAGIFILLQALMETRTAPDLNQPITQGPTNITNNPKHKMDDVTPWHASIPKYTYQSGPRSKEAYDQLIDQFLVEENPRYTPRNGYTYCNIFAWDVSLAMGVELPRFVEVGEKGNVEDATGKAIGRTLTKGYVAGSTATELNANRLAKWLDAQGANYGWREITPEEAQARANQGYMTISVIDESPRIGHVQVIRPTPDGRAYDSDKGVYLAQAGASNSNGTYFLDYYKDREYYGRYKFYTHD